MAASPFSENKKLLLADCAELSVGYSFRGRIETAETGRVRLVQMRDLGEDGLVQFERSAHCEDPGLSPAHLLREGDLVFRARGTNNKTAYVAETPEGAALASPLIRVRIQSPDVEPRYVQWFMNLPPSLAFFSSGLQGSLVRMVSIEHLARLELVMPPLEAQRRTVELSALCEREAGILRRLAELAELRGRLALAKRLFA